MKLREDPAVLVRMWLGEAAAAAAAAAAGDPKGGGGGQHSDVRLVCSDGELEWSAILLASQAAPALAEGLTGLSRCDVCCSGSQVVILLKEFK